MRHGFGGVYGGLYEDEPWSGPSGVQSGDLSSKKIDRQQPVDEEDKPKRKTQKDREEQT